MGTVLPVAKVHRQLNGFGRRYANATTPRLFIGRHAQIWQGGR